MQNMLSILVNMAKIQDLFKRHSLLYVFALQPVKILDNGNPLLEYYNTRSNAEDVLGRMFYPESCVVKEGYFPESLKGLFRSGLQME